MHAEFYIQMQARQELTKNYQRSSVAASSTALKRTQY